MAVAADVASHPPAPKPLSSSAKMQAITPDISVVAHLSFGWFSGNEHIRQDGHSAGRKGFSLQGLELLIGGNVDPDFRYDMNFQLVSLELEEAALSTLVLPANLQFRAGKPISAFGRQNARHLHSWSFVTPSLSHTRFMGENYLGGLGSVVTSNMFSLDTKTFPFIILLSRLHSEE